MLGQNGRTRPFNLFKGLSDRHVVVSELDTGDKRGHTTAPLTALGAPLLSRADKDLFPASSKPRSHSHMSPFGRLRVATGLAR